MRKKNHYWPDIRSTHGIDFRNDTAEGFYPFAGKHTNA